MCYDLCVKVQVRHWPCGQVVSCVCAVAIREGDLILAADMCADGVMHYLSNNQALPIGTWIDVFSGGNSFQVSLCINQMTIGFHDTSSTDISSTDISSTTVYQRTGHLYIQLLFQQIIIFINSNFYLHYDSSLSIPLPLTLLIIQHIQLASIVA